MVTEHGVLLVVHGILLDWSWFELHHLVCSKNHQYHNTVLVPDQPIYFVIVIMVFHVLKFLICMDYSFTGQRRLETEMQ